MPHLVAKRHVGVIAIGNALGNSFVANRLKAEENKLKAAAKPAVQIGDEITIDGQKGYVAGIDENGQPTSISHSADHLRVEREQQAAWVRDYKVQDYIRNVELSSGTNYSHSFSFGAMAGNSGMLRNSGDFGDGFYSSFKQQGRSYSSSFKDRVYGNGYNPLDVVSGTVGLAGDLWGGAIKGVWDLAGNISTVGNPYRYHTGEAQQVWSELGSFVGGVKDKFVTSYDLYQSGQNYELGALWGDTGYDTFVGLASGGPLGLRNSVALRTVGESFDFLVDAFPSGSRSGIGRTIGNQVGAIDFNLYSPDVKATLLERFNNGNIFETNVLSALNLESNYSRLYPVRPVDTRTSGSRTSGSGLDVCHYSTHARVMQAKMTADLFKGITSRTIRSNNSLITRVSCLRILCE